jgi:S-disulfanyl-L-cysteine oxidoreductase SoxD
MRSVRGLSLSAVGLTAVAGGMLAWFAPALPAQQTRNANDGVYTDAQAARGRALYKDKCATCHGDALEGKAAPPLTGTAFLAVWGAQPLSELAGKIQNTMPANNTGKLKPSETAELVAYILQTGKFPSGQAELASDENALKSVVLAPANARAAAPAASQAPAFPAMGNLAQVMRGLLFPNSNIIFNVQLHDPAEKAKPAQPNADTFSWTAWGDEIYGGWQMIDYAAVAIAESAPLMLTPGRRCENGKPVPVDRADWIKFTQELAEAGRAAYRASQTRDQQTVSDISGQLSDSCLHCHRVYRDKRGGSAAHCTP